MSYLVDILGHVAAYGIRAEEACRAVIEHTVEECAYIVCQKTGLSFDFLTPMKGEIMERIMKKTNVQPTVCRGKTKHGTPCKRLTLYGFCSDHREQEEHTLQKKRRLTNNGGRRKTIDLTSLRMMRYQFW